MRRYFGFLLSRAATQKSPFGWTLKPIFPWKMKAMPYISRCQCLHNISMRILTHTDLLTGNGLHSPVCTLHDSTFLCHKTWAVRHFGKEGATLGGTSKPSFREPHNVSSNHSLPKLTEHQSTAMALGRANAEHRFLKWMICVGSHYFGDQPESLNEYG